MSLTTAVASLAAVVSQSGDSQAAQLELLHDIEAQLRVAPSEEIKAAQADLEKHLTTALLQGPAPPIRHLISSCFCYAFGRGSRQGMYTTVGSFLSWMSNKASPANSVSSKAAILMLLGDLSYAQGNNMVSLCHDTIALLIKSIRAPEALLRTAACNALAAALGGSGGVGKPVQEEALKNIKAVVAERGAPVELRSACLVACPPLVANSEQLWASDLVEQVAALCTKHLDDPSPSVRQAAAETLGASLVACLAHPFVVPGQAPRGSKKAAPPAKRPSFGTTKMVCAPAGACPAPSCPITWLLLTMHATRCSFSSCCTV